MTGTIKNIMMFHHIYFNTLLSRQYNRFNMNVLKRSAISAYESIRLRDRNWNRAGKHYFRKINLRIPPLLL